MFEKTCLGTFLALPQLCNQGTIQGKLCRIKQTSPEMLIYIGFLKGDTNSTKEGSLSTKHFQIVSIPQLPSLLSEASAPTVMMNHDIKINKCIMQYSY